MPEIKRSLIDLFEDNELKISILYKIYAQKLPAHEEFWMRLSHEEVLHAQDIAKKNSAALIKSFEENKFSRGVINYVMDYVEKQILFAKNNAFSHQQALNTALRVEQSILEKKCFEMFLPTDTPVKNLFEKLNRETDKHVKLLRKELNKQKNPS